MSRGELAIIAAAVLAAVGLGLWVHPGAGLVAGAVALALYGIVEIRFPEQAAEEPAAEPTRSDPGRREVRG